MMQFTYYSTTHELSPAPALEASCFDVSNVTARYVRLAIGAAVDDEYLGVAEVAFLSAPVRTLEVTIKRDADPVALARFLELYEQLLPHLEVRATFADGVTEAVSNDLVSSRVTDAHCALRTSETDTFEFLGDSDRR